MKTKTLLPYASVTTYDLKKNWRGRTFTNEAAALKALKEAGSATYNIYRIEKVNGTWRTDWELEA